MSENLLLRSSRSFVAEAVGPGGERPEPATPSATEMWVVQAITRLSNIAVIWGAR